jgi:hypothetical protein
MLVRPSSISSTVVGCLASTGNLQSVVELLLNQQVHEQCCRLNRQVYHSRPFASQRFAAECSSRVHSIVHYCLTVLLL